MVIRSGVALLLAVVVAACSGKRTVGKAPGMGGAAGGGTHGGTSAGTATQGSGGTAGSGEGGESGSPDGGTAGGISPTGGRSGAVGTGTAGAAGASGSAGQDAPRGGTGGQAGAAVGGAGGIGGIGGESPQAGSAGSAGMGGVAPPETHEGTPGDVDWEPFPVTFPAILNECDVDYLEGADPESDQDFVLGRWLYDEPTRVLRASSTGFGAGDFVSRAMRFDEEGRLLLLYRYDTDLRLDYERDEHGNTVAIWENTMDGFDPSTAEPLTGDVTRFIHTYDENGALRTSAVDEPEALRGTLTYRTDEAGRCAGVEWEGAGGERETQTCRYDLGGRLAELTTVATSDPSDVRSVSEYWYDPEGALIAIVQDGVSASDGGARFPVDGIADRVLRTEEETAKSRFLELLDFTTTEVNDGVTRSGVMTGVSRHRWRFSTGCAPLILPRRTSQKCEFSLPSRLIPVGFQSRAQR